MESNNVRTKSSIEKSNRTILTLKTFFTKKDGMEGNFTVKIDTAGYRHDTLIADKLKAQLNRMIGECNINMKGKL